MERPRRDGAPSGPPESGELRSSLTLLERTQKGDRAAMEALMTSYLPRLRRWASGRLPRSARDSSDTQTLCRKPCFRRFRGSRRSRSVEKGRCRRTSARPSSTASGKSCAAPAAAVERYERALATLRREEREAVVSRIQLGYTNDEIAGLLGKPSANGARMAVERAIVKLAKAMGIAKP